MVKIPVDDRDFIHTIQADGCPDCSIIENTKTHCPVRFCMVSRRRIIAKQDSPSIERFTASDAAPAAKKLH